ncbi:cell division protein SepF [Streptococcus hongkongensis]|nr:cell division protein SepF [Streptococcus uberis]
MAFKDTFNKMISYFDTDEVSEVEGDEQVQAVADQEKPQQPSRPSQPLQQARPSQPTSRPVQQPSSSRSSNQYTTGFPSQSRSQMTENTERKATHNSYQSAIPTHNSQQQIQANSSQGQTTIALKYPKRYEDAQEIVDLLIENECVLIDFQFMLDAQARRCLDFIDGASKVLYGTLQKVGSSMYLLTPSNVSVNIEDMNIPNSNQDFGYDFDMKRR